MPIPMLSSLRGLAGALGQQRRATGGGPGPSPSNTTLPEQTSPGGVAGSLSLFGRPGWTYVQVDPAPRLGPLPRLTRATPTPATQEFQPDYQPDTFDYLPAANENRIQRIPDTIRVGTDGRELVGTYRARDFTPAKRMRFMGRAAPPWQQQAFPPGPRALLAAQQVAKYQVMNQIALARPLSQANYFVGYVADPQVYAQFGASGGPARPLGG